ncbi:MAG: hypothetical protein K2X35_01810 [Bryobacteraceae bacterium]|nr:hypothetical protein [Bryobacteraceae bacterium]
MLWIRAALFTFLLPGFVAGWAPWWIRSNYPAQLETFGLRWAGWILLAPGAALLLAAVLTFVRSGKGTGAIFFSRRMRWLVGEEPGRVVSQAVYAYTRNPMYAGVLLMILGQALWFENRALLWYFLGVAAMFQFTVVVLEEPHLRRKDPAGFDAYTRRVPRWFGRRG